MTCQSEGLRFSLRGGGRVWGRAGDLVHTHTGGNVGKLENFVREQLEKGGDPVPASLELGVKKQVVPS